MKTEIEVKIVPLQSFVKKAGKIWPQVPLAAVLRSVAMNYHNATAIGGGLYKVRLKIEGSGKRGGARVIFFEYGKENELILLTVYKKAQIETLSVAQVAQLKALTQDFLATKGNAHGRAHIRGFKVRPRRG